MMIQRKKDEKSWVSLEIKIWIVIKKEEKRQGLDYECLQLQFGRVTFFLKFGVSSNKTN